MRDSCTYSLTGTKTFRLGSRKILGKYGGNLQNKEKSMRELYIPDDGKILVQVDCSGAEALIVAYLCRNGAYRSLFKNGVKPHVFIALHLFPKIWQKKMAEHRLDSSDIRCDIDELLNTPIPDLKKNPFWRTVDTLIKDSDNWSLAERYYYLAKQTEHSSNYDIHAPTFRMNILEKSGGKIVISKDDSERFLLIKHSLFPEIREDFHAGVRREVEQTRMMYNLHGHPYNITSYELMDSKWKELYSWKPQSTVGEITNIAVTRQQEFVEREGLDWDILANTHDSYLSQCPIGEELYCAKKMCEHIEQEFTSPFDGEKFNMRSEAVCGYNWRPYHKEKNPNGLKEIK